MIPVAEKIPGFWSLASQIASALKTGAVSGWDALNEQFDPLSDASFVDDMDKRIPGWRKIATLHEGQTARHTLMVLASCLNLPEYEQASEQTQKEIEWAAVLHDFDKERTRNDTAHPFRSAAVAAQVMPQLGFQRMPGVDTAQVEAWSSLVMSAQREDGDRMVHDHRRLPQIIHSLRQCWGEGTTASRVLKAILLHQSLPTLKDWSNAVLMNDEELSNALTLEDMDVLGPLMIADSDSWNIFDDTRIAYLAELRASNTETRRRILNRDLKI